MTSFTTTTKLNLILFGGEEKRVKIWLLFLSKSKIKKKEKLKLKSWNRFNFVTC